MIQQYDIKVSNEDIDLLKQKIALTRWPDEINNNWSHGTDLNFLKDLANQWANEFDCSNWSVFFLKYLAVPSRPTPQIKDTTTGRDIF